MKRPGEWLVIGPVFGAGLGVVLWVAAGYAATSPLALGVLSLIAAAYCAGAWELRRMSQDTAALGAALGRLPTAWAELDSWLATLPPSLRPVLARRVEGERVALPGPTMAPYLVGLLVLLGMLGTFLGMVVTLKGAVLALDRTADLAALRQAISAPVRGLGLAFGTSVAGVAASAALGLLAALARRQRVQVAQALDAALAGPLRSFSAAQQRLQAREAQRLARQQAQQQAEQQDREERRSLWQARHQAERAEREAQHAQWQAQQHAQQQAHAEMLQAHARLAPEMLAQWQGAMAQMQRQAEALDARLLAAQDHHQQQALALQAQLADTVHRALEQHLRDSFAQTAQMVQSAREGWQPLIEATLQELAGQAAQLRTLTHQAVQQHLQSVDHRLSDTLVAQAAQQTQQSAALGHLLEALDRTAAEQRKAVEALLASSSAVLEQVGERFFSQVETAAGALAAASGQLQGGAVEVASLGEAFGVAVQCFVDTTRGLGEHLQRVEEALRRTTHRSDEQLAYYVAQARELIELSVASHKQILDGIQELGTSAAPAVPDLSKLPAAPSRTAGSAVQAP